MNEKIFRAQVGVNHAAGMDICDRFSSLHASLFANREAYIAVLNEALLETAMTGLGEEQPWWSA